MNLRQCLVLPKFRNINYKTFSLQRAKNRFTPTLPSLYKIATVFPLGPFHRALVLFHRETQKSARRDAAFGPDLAPDSFAKQAVEKE